MSEVLFYPKIYLRLIGQYLKSRLAYRKDTFFEIFGLLGLNLLGVLSLIILFKRIPSLAGWSYYEMLYLYGYMMLCCLPQTIFFDRLWELSGELEWGNFILYYFRPVSIMFSFIAERINLKSFNQVVIAFFLLFYAGGKLDIDWTAAKILCFAYSCIGSALLYLGLRILTSATAFWTISNISLMNFVANLESFSRYPVTVFARGFRIMFTYILPFVFLAYVPVNIILHRDSFSIQWLMTPAAGTIIITAAVIVWKLGIRSYSGTGS